MKKRFVFITLCLWLSASALAQQERKKEAKDCGCSFRSINQVGVLEGSAGSAFQAQSINGIAFGQWFAGIGIGLDHYRHRTVPVFFDLRREILKRPNTPFVYGNAGVHFPWVAKKEQQFWYDSKYEKGLYYDAGIGYKIKVGKNYGLLFSGGFSLKKMREIRYFDAPCIDPPCPGESERFDFTLKRFSLKAGLQL